MPLTGAYTTEDEGLEIVVDDAEYGPQAAGASGVTRQFTIDNLTAKPLSLAIALPRQFVLSGAPCAGLAPNASCNFSVSFLPLDNGDLTGTLFATGTPTDGSATLDGIGYVEGYGLGGGTLAVTGGLQPGGILSFGQVPSGQSVQKILTLTNASSTATLTIRRITSEWPFLSTTTCGTTLAPAATCTVTLTYTPTNQVAAGSSPPPTTADSGELAIESDAGSSPDLIDLTGSSTPVYVTSPTNVAPLATITPSQSSLTFANTMVGNVSAPQTVTLDNTGTATLNILGLQTTPDYTVSSNCASIVPGASCTLTVTFTPQYSTQQGSGSGQRASAIEVSSNATTSLEFISVVGVSSPSSLTIAQSSLNFGTVPVGANFEPAIAAHQHRRQRDHLRHSLRHNDAERRRRRLYGGRRQLPAARPGSCRGHKLHSAGCIRADAVGDTHGNALDCKLGIDPAADGGADRSGRAVAHADPSREPELRFDCGQLTGQPVADALQQRHSVDHRRCAGRHGRLRRHRALCGDHAGCRAEAAGSRSPLRRQRLARTMER